MKLQRTIFSGFRNHTSLLFEPSEGVTIIYGANGSGKTSLLEGIHYGALTKGLLGAPDSECLSFDTEAFTLDSHFLSDSNIPIHVLVTYQLEGEKQVIVDRQEVKPFSSHIGRIPTITFSPYEISLVSGPPAERRRFLDSAISQLDHRYLDRLITYRRILQQRNALLAQLSSGEKSNRNTLPLWTTQLAELSAWLVERRLLFLTSFSPYFQHYYRYIIKGEEPSINYRCTSCPLHGNTTFQELYQLFLQRYSDIEAQEIQRGQTLFGAHRDDVLFFLNEKEIKRYASQGQLRSFLIALKISQAHLFADHLHEQPMCLFDDLFSELDGGRIEQILALLKECGQTIITAVEPRYTEGITLCDIQALR
uniref:DNA replication and repair protein RecF n=1 Tax=Chlorobium chlorochromatii (strain CaD3) TaxID=340177 RepID=Q3AUE9_CHLCH